MQCIVGLGNPGKKFEHTRHNAGFIIAKHFAGDLQPNFNNMPEYVWYTIDTAKEVFLLLPLEYMNESGRPIKHFLEKKYIKPNELLVIHDDLDLEFGKFKFSFDASAAGHNGVQSIIDHLGTQKFWRLRYGIDGSTRNGMPGEEYVLNNFSKDETDQILNDTKVREAIATFLNSGPEAAMQLYHTKNRP